MHPRRRAGDALRLAQEGSFFRIAFNEMNHRAGRAGERNGEHHAGEAGARAEVDPNPRLWGKLDELQRIGDMPGPKIRKRRRRDEIGFSLPLDEQRSVPIQPSLCFT